MAIQKHFGSDHIKTWKITADGKDLGKEIGDLRTDSGDIEEFDSVEKDDPEVEASAKEESAAKPTRSLPEAYFLPGLQC